MEASSVARQIFEDIDVNGDRVLSSDELRAWLERKGEEALSNQLFALLDTDGDGVVTLQEFVDGFCNLQGKLAKIVSGNSPVFRAVSLAWLQDFVKENAGTTHSWDVVKEFMAEKDGGGKEAVLRVTPDNLDAHREMRRAAEQTKSGKPIPVSYHDIPFEQMYTTDVVEGFVRSLARTEHKSYAQAKDLPVGAPTYFISHAWNSSFVDLVESVASALAGAAKEDTFVWLDIFAINQDDTGGVFSAMHELDDGKTLARTVEIARATLVVLDKERVIPLTRLWCLYEMGSTPPQKLQLVTHGFSERDISQNIRNIDAESALCFSLADKEMIHGEITGKFGFPSLQHFTDFLKVGLLLRPMSYESDVKSWKERGKQNQYHLDDIREYVSSTGGRLACIVGGPGEGKSSVATAALGLVHASHFCKRADVRRQDMSEMVRSLAFQLARHFDEVRTCLVALDEDEAANALVDADAAVYFLLVQPLKKLAESREHAMILLDALDEADDEQHSSNSAITLLRHLAREVREGISVIVTTRPDAEGGFPRMRVLDYDWQQQAGSGGMLTLTPAQVLGSTAGAMVENEHSHQRWREVMQNMNSSKVYQIVAQAYAKRHSTKSVDPPTDVDAAYRLWFDKMRKDDEKVRQLIDIVLASREPLSSAHIDQLGLRMACERLPCWGLLFEERDHLLQTLHLSLREYLGSKKRSGEHAADTNRGHCELAESCVQLLLRGDEEKGPAVSYAVRHGHVHLCAWVEQMVVMGEGVKSEQEKGGLALVKEWHSAFLEKRQIMKTFSDEYATSDWCATKFAGHWLKRQLECGRHKALVVELLSLEGALAQLVGVLEDGDVQSLHSFIRVLRWGVSSYSQLAALGRNMPCTSAWYESEGSLQLTPQLLRLPIPRVDIDATLLNNMRHKRWQHFLPVNSVQYSPDDTRIASASDDGTVRVWDATTGACLSTLEGHFGGVRSAAWSPDGKRIASAGEDGTVRVWDATTGACVSTFEGNSWGVTSVAWSPDGTRIASAREDETVRVWDATTGACESTLEGHGEYVASAAWSPDGKRIASASNDNTVRVWDATTGACVSTLEGHSRDVTSAAWSPDGTRIASTSEDNTMRVWDATTGACESTLENEGHSYWLRSAAWSPDGKRIASVTEKTVRVWDATTGACESTLEGHSDTVWSAAWSQDGNRIASACEDGTVRVWDATTSACVPTVDGHSWGVRSAAYSPDGKHIASASNDKTVRVWDATTGACVSTLRGHSGRVWSAAWSPDGKRIASAGGEDNTVRVWDATTGACECTLEGHGEYVTSAAWSPDGKRIASASNDKTVRVWDATTGACVSTLEGHHRGAISAAWSPDGKRIASGSGDNRMRVWDATTGACESTLEGHSSWVTSAAWSPDGKRIASTSEDNTLRVWDATTGACESTLEGHFEGLTSAAWSPDGTRIASASRDKTVRVWDATTGACESTLEGHSSWVRSAAWSPDGKRIVSASEDTTVCVWDARR